MQYSLSTLRDESISNEAERALAGRVSSVLTYPEDQAPRAPERGRNERPVLALRKILVATDFSPASTKAVERAVALAEQCQAALTILHVIDVNAPAESGAASDLMQHLWDEGSTRMGQLAWTLSGQVEARTMVAEGLPWEVIVETSRDFDLLIVAKSHSRRSWNFFPRHTSRRLIELAACPVMVVSDQD